MATTALTVKNDYTSRIEVWVSLGEKDPRSSIPVVADVRNLITPSWSPIRLIGSDPKLGFFRLQPGVSATLAQPTGYGIVCWLTYKFPPTECNPLVGAPPREAPTAVDLKLNSGIEMVHIDCIGGINACWHMDFVGGQQWNSVAGIVTEVENKAFGSNRGQVGVFPYGCDECTSSQDPPPCIEPGVDNEPPQTSQVCYVWRSGLDSPGGGEVRVVFKNPL